MFWGDTPPNPLIFSFHPHALLTAYFVTFQRPASEPPEPAKELISDNELLTMNEPFIVQAKGRFKEAKNKKRVMTRAEKTKAKFIKRDPSDFKHVEVSLRRGDRGDRGTRDDRDDRGERSNKKVKKFSVTNIVAIMKTDIQAIEKTSAVINRDVQAILTKAEVKARTKGASNNLIVDTNKTAIEISSDDEFEAFTTDEETMKEAMNMSN